MTDYDSDNPMAGVPDWALRPTALYGASGTVWVRSDPAPSGLIGWYPDGAGIAKPWLVVERDHPSTTPPSGGERSDSRNES